MTKELGVFLGNIAKSCSEIKMGLDLLILKKCKNLEAEENNFMDIESSYSRVLFETLLSDKKLNVHPYTTQKLFITLF